MRLQERKVPGNVPDDNEDIRGVLSQSGFICSPASCGESDGSKAGAAPEFQFLQPSEPASQSSKEQPNSKPESKAGAAPASQSMPPPNQDSFQPKKSDPISSSEDEATSTDESGKDDTMTEDPPSTRRPAVDLLVAVALLVVAGRTAAADDSHDHPGHIGHGHGGHGAAPSGHRCIHDRLDRPAVSTSTRSRVLYDHTSWEVDVSRRGEDGSGGKERRLATTVNNATRSALRIHAAFIKQNGALGAVDSEDSALVQKIKNELVPSAVAFWQDALSTFPVVGALRFDRNCGGYIDMSDYGKGIVCTTIKSPETCHPQDPNSQIVPEAWLNSREKCDACYGDGSCSSCVEHPAGGDGLTETDFALLVTIADTTICQNAPSTAAYAYTCRWDQYDRPILGYMNFCPKAMGQSDEMDDALKLLTIKHEIAHALGFNAETFALMRERDGKTPRTSREGGGNIGPVPETSITCADGSIKSVRAPAESTVWRGTISGRGITNAFKLATPTVVAAARQYFGCSTMNGVELENTPTSSGACFGSHWEQRVLDGEAMAAQVTDASSKFSELTFAAFHDMGFYAVDFSKSDANMVWGRGEGCTFLDEKCVIEGGTTAKLENKGYFCIQQNSERCSPDRRARSTCFMVDYSNYGLTIPANMQYFSDNGGLGGFVATRDYCPSYEPYTNGYCEDVEDQTPFSKNYAGEEYGSGSRCIEGSLLEEGRMQPAGWSAETQRKPACLMTRCVLNPSDGGLRFVEIMAKRTSDGSQVSAKCYDNDVGSRKSMPQYFRGSFVCPDIDLVCRSGPYASQFELTCDTPSADIAPEGYNLTGETGSRADGQSCVDVCDAAAKNACAASNKEDCVAGSIACGNCKAGFKADGQSCVDVCDATAKQ
eukprot:g5228.t1